MLRFTPQKLSVIWGSQKSQQTIQLRNLAYLASYIIYKFFKMFESLKSAPFLFHKDKRSKVSSKHCNSVLQEFIL